MVIAIWIIKIFIVYWQLIKIHMRHLSVSYVCNEEVSYIIVDINKYIFILFSKQSLRVTSSKMTA